MSGFSNDFRTQDLSSAYRSELAKIRQFPGGGGSMHLTCAAKVDGDPSTIGIVSAPIQSLADPSNPRGFIQVWGPVPADCRYAADNAGDPVQANTMLVEPDGSWAIWQKGVGYVEQAGTVAAAKFDSSGICIQAGFTPGGQWYSVGDKTEHPSNGGIPPGVPPAGGATIQSLAEELLAAAKSKGV